VAERAGSSPVVEASPRSVNTGRGIRRIRVPQKLRNLELFLLIIACGMNAFAVVMVQFGALGSVDGTVITLGASLSVLVVGMHIALRFVAPNADPFILPIAAILNGIGIAVIYHVDLIKGHTGWDSVAIRQVVWSAIALVCAIAVVVIIRNHRVLQRYTYIFMFAAFVLLLLPMIPGIGQEIFGARVWIHIGPFSFQPGEIAKILLAIFFAGFLVQRRDTLSLVGRKILGVRFPRARDLGPIIVIWALSMSVIVFQRDLGTALLYFGLFVVMLYVATGRTSWILLGGALFLAGAVIASQTLTYVNDRFSAWLDPFSQKNYDEVGGSFQLVQGIFGLANGGLIGTGLGRGRPDITPLAQSDFIVSALGEELGLAGLFAILCLYLLLIARGLRISFAGHDDFGRLLGVGLSFVIALQCFVVIGGVTRVIPLTGLTTPFLASGGSSLMANWIIVALLLRLSDTVRNQPRLVI
jgi:cell division protein FtsW (lipid II flippase)